MTKVVNIKHIRNNPNWRKETIYIGRGSPFGNPFHIGKDGTRAEVIEKYSELFYEVLVRDFAEDGDFVEKLLALRNKTLACYCRPVKGFQGKVLCHGQVIAAYLDGIEPEEVL